MFFFFFFSQNEGPWKGGRLRRASWLKERQLLATARHSSTQRSNGGKFSCSIVRPTRKCWWHLKMNEWINDRIFHLWNRDDENKNCFGGQVSVIDFCLWFTVFRSSPESTNIIYPIKYALFDNKITWRITLFCVSNNKLWHMSAKGIARKQLMQISHRTPFCKVKSIMIWFKPLDRTLASSKFKKKKRSTSITIN